MIKKLLLIIATLSLCSCDNGNTMSTQYKHAHLQVENVVRHYDIDKIYVGSNYVAVHTQKGWIETNAINLVLYESEECVLCGVVDYD